MVSNHHGSNLKQCGTFYVTKKERRKDLGILSLFFFLFFSISTKAAEHIRQHNEIVAISDHNR